MKQRSGAFQLSIGLIVVIVFAVIVLSLSIVWIQGLLKQITYITKDLTQQAQNKIQDTFQETDQNFAVWPNDYEMERSTELKLSAGIKNNDQFGQVHSYVINVVSQDAEETTNWDISFAQFPIQVPLDKTAYIPIVVKPPSNAQTKTYIFYVVACADIASPASCTLTNNPNMWGSPQPLMLTITA